MESLFRYLDNFVQLNNIEKQQLASQLTKKTYSKNQVLLRAGETAKCFCYIEKGLLRSFYVNEKGIEKTDAFFFTGYLATDFQSYIDQIPSNKTIEAMEDTVVYCLNHESRLKLEKESNIFIEITRALSQKAIRLMQKRYESLFLATPEERYLHLIRKHPEIFQKIHLKHIAEFINVRPQSLSRIRKRIKIF